MMDSLSRGRSLWQYRLSPDGTTRPTVARVKASATRFARVLFGSTSEVQLRQATEAPGEPVWELTIRADGQPIEDRRYTEWMHAQWCRWLQHPFGVAATIRCDAWLVEDGEDGSPVDAVNPSAIDHKGSLS
jgi:hypothetical protein